MKRYHKIVLTFCLGIIILIGNSIATSTSYTSTLPRTLLPNTIVNGRKTSSSDQNATNRIDEIGGKYDVANVWIDDTSGSKAANTVRMYEGQGTYTLPYNRDVKSGESLKLRMSNATFTYVNVTVKGYVNFK